MKTLTRRLPRDIIIEPNDRSKNTYHYMDWNEVDRQTKRNGYRYIFINSARTEVGKSYGVKTYKTMDLIKKGKKVLLIRNKKKELEKTKSYFKEMLPDFNSHYKCDYSEIVTGMPEAGAISIKYGFTDDDGKIIKDDQRYIHIGYHLSLAHGIDAKGGWDADIEMLIYEEYNAPTLSHNKRKDLLIRFVDLFVTYFRERQIEAYFLANNYGHSNPIEKMFDESPYAVKWKYFKKAPVQSNYTGINKEVLNYIEGEGYYNKNIKLSDYQLINWIKIGNKHYYIYRHKYKVIDRESYYISDKGRQEKFETDLYLYNRFDDVEFQFSSNKVQENFDEDHQNIHSVLGQRLPKVRSTLKKYYD